jgi:hypothetical protein
VIRRSALREPRGSGRLILALFCITLGLIFRKIHLDEFARAPMIVSTKPCSFPGLNRVRTSQFPLRALASDVSWAAGWGLYELQDVGTFRKWTSSLGTHPSVASRFKRAERKCSASSKHWPKRNLPTKACTGRLRGRHEHADGEEC